MEKARDDWKRAAELDPSRAGPDHPTNVVEEKRGGGERPQAAEIMVQRGVRILQQSDQRREVSHFERILLLSGPSPAL